MIRSSTAKRLLVGAAAFSTIASAAAAQAQVSLDDQKKQLEIEQLELNKQKTVAEMIKGSAGSAAGNATLTTLEQSAEGLMLARQVQKRTAWAIVSNLGKADDRIVSVIFGDQPASTADYLAVERGVAALEENLSNANMMARAVYGEAEAPVEPDDPEGEFEASFVPGAIPLALTAVTTIASLLRVNTNVTGAALATPNEQFKAILTQELERYHWKVDQPRAIVAETAYADDLFKRLKGERDLATKYYLKYLASVTKAKDGKAANLPDGEIIVGKALETALNDHAALARALYTPVNGILPATIVGEQAKLVKEAVAGQRRILYIQHHKAALTSITKQGTFTGIFSVPAYVSASHVVEYALTNSANPKIGSFDTVRYDTPVMRVTGVRTWLARQEKAEADAAAKPLAKASPPASPAAGR